MKLKKFLLLLSICFTMNIEVYAEEIVKDVFIVEEEVTEIRTENVYTDNYFKNIENLGYELEYKNVNFTEQKFTDSKGFRSVVIDSKIKGYNKEFSVYMFKELGGDTDDYYSNKLYLGVEISTDAIFTPDEIELYSILFKAMSPLITEEDTKKLDNLSNEISGNYLFHQVDENEYFEIIKREGRNGKYILNIKRYYDYEKLPTISVNRDLMANYEIKYEEIMEKKDIYDSYHVFSGTFGELKYNKVNQHYFTILKRDGDGNKLYYGYYDSIPEIEFNEGDEVTVEGVLEGLVIIGKGKPHEMIMPRIKIVKVY